MPKQFYSTMLRGRSSKNSRYLSQRRNSSLESLLPSSSQGRMSSTVSLDLEMDSQASGCLILQIRAIKRDILLEDTLKLSLESHSKL